MKIHSGVPSPMLSERRLLLHLKCLVWCLHQMKTRYDLNLVLYSLERGALHDEISDSNLGDNVAYLLESLEPEDVARVSDALSNLPLSTGSLDAEDKRLEIGHYVQAVSDFGPIKRGSYGVISALTPQARGLFVVDGEAEHLMEAVFDPAQVRAIYGTYVI